MQASLKFSGDFAALRDFEEKIRRSPASLRRISVQLAEETIELIHEGHERQLDPYGKPWKPPVLRSGDALEDSGGMKNSWHRSHAKRESFGVENAKAYAIFHQTGTGIYGPRRRRIYPLRKRALRIPGGRPGYVNKGDLFFSSVAGSPQRRMVPDRGLPEDWRARYVDTATQTLAAIFR